MATNFANVPTAGFALRGSAKLGAATLLVTLLLSLATLATLHAPIHVDETGFEASAAAE